MVFSKTVIHKGIKWEIMPKIIPFLTSNCRDESIEKSNFKLKRKKYSVNTKYDLIIHVFNSLYLTITLYFISV